MLRLPLIISLLILCANCNSREGEIISSTLSSVGATVNHLLSVDDVFERMQMAEAPVLIELGRSTSYEAGHIPEAFLLSRDDYGDQDAYAYAGMRADKAQLEELLGNLGLSNEQLIILYDDYGNVDAARFFWLLINNGHEHVAIMDGGKVAWQLANLPLSTLSPPNPVPTDYHFPKQVNFTQLATIDEVRQAIQDTNTVILDTRELEEFLGQPYISNNKLYRHKAGAATNGCIPTAIHFNWTDAVNLSGDHRFDAFEVLRQRFISLGVSPDKNIIAYCQSGVRSAHTTFVLSKILGYEQVKNYDGSWIEWSYYYAHDKSVDIQQYTDSSTVERMYQELSSDLEQLNQ